MIIRSGFISNSSSSSFIIPKMYLTESERIRLKEKCEEMNIYIDDDRLIITGSVHLGSDKIKKLIEWIETDYEFDNIKQFIRCFQGDEL